MATLLDAPKPAPKVDDLIERRFGEVRQRIRLLDAFVTAGWLLLGSMLFLFAVLLFDRHFETPPGLGWVALAAYLGAAGGFAYLDLLRPSRRQINPYYVARQVEATMPQAKNSVVNWVDLHDDQGIDLAIRQAVTSRASRDIKAVDIDRAIERKQVVWLAGLAVLGFVMASIVYFLPPLRTRIELVTPAAGDVTLFSTQDFQLQARLIGRIPEPGAPDAARLRIWYNPDDLETFEDRPLEPSPDDRQLWGTIVSARQTRTGFLYQVLAGKAATPRYALKVRILPVIESFEARYEYPEYLNKAPETLNDLNLIGYYGTKVTLTVRTNQPLQAGQLVINQGEATVPGVVPEAEPHAVVFSFPLQQQGRYRIGFTTVEGEKNVESPNPKITLLDPLPQWTHFEVHYQYPAYLRWKNHHLKEITRPELDAMRGTRVTLTAHANRPIREAGLRFPGQAQLIPGTGVPGKPQSIQFELPPLDRSGEAQVWFEPVTAERRTEPLPIKITVRPDETPVVEITKPDKPEVEIPANGTLAVDGFATDDYGVKSMALRISVLAPVPQELSAKVYRDGKGFQRARDQSYPRRIDYKDSQKLQELKTADGKPVTLRGGEILEYWLEATDNCDVPPGPHTGLSAKKRVKVLPPKEQQDPQNQQRQQEEQQNQQQQDQKNEQENRDPNQPPPKAGDQNQQNPEPKDGKPDPNQKPEQKEGKPDPNQKPEQKGGNPEQKEGKQDPNQKPERKDGTPEQKENPADQKSDEQLQREAEDLQRQLDEQKAQNKPGPKDQPPPQREPPANQKPQPKQGEPKQGEPKEQEPKQGQQQPAEQKPEPKQGEQDPATPKPDTKPEPKQGEPKQGEPKQGEPKQGEPKQGEPKQGEPKQGEPKEREPKQGEPKPNENNPQRGENKPEPKQGGQQPENAPAQNKPERTENPAEQKPAPKQGNDPGGENKPMQPGKEDPQQPKTPEGNAKPQPKSDTPQGNNKPEAGEPKQGEPKQGEPKEGGGKEGGKEGEPKKLDSQQLRDMAKDLKDPQKREEALRKMQDLARDPKNVEEAKKQLEEFNKSASEQEKKDLADAMKELQDAAQNAPKEPKEREPKKNGKEGEPKQGNGKEGEPKNGEPKNGKEGEPKQGEPKKTEPKQGNGKEGEPKNGKEGEPKQGEPKNGKEGEPKQGEPKNGKDGEPKKGEPKQGEPKNGKQGEPKQGEPKNGKEGEPKQGEPKNGKQGEPKKGEPKQGEPKKGSGKEGEPKKGEPKEGDPTNDADPQQNPGGKAPEQLPDPKEGPKANGGNRKGDPKGEEVTDPLLADKKNQLKAGQMQLEKFKANEKALREQKKWTEQEWQEFMQSYEKMLDRRRQEINQLERDPRRPTGASSLNGSERIQLKERGGADPLQGGKFVPPPGYLESYRQFTGEGQPKPK